MSGCHDGSGPSADVRIRIFGTSFSRTRDTTIADRRYTYVNVPFTIHNSLSEPVSVRHCGGRLSMVLERWSDTAWTRPYMGAFCPSALPLPDDHYSSATEIAPGATFLDSIAVTEAGTYRIRPIWENLDVSRTPYPDWLSTESAAFRVR